MTIINYADGDDDDDDDDNKNNRHNNNFLFSFERITVSLCSVIYAWN